MRVALISTYELGRQPLHVASPAAALEHAGHTVRTLDLAVEAWSDDLIQWADAVAFSTPMHTALRLATEGAGRVRTARPGLPVAAYGLYAEMADPTLFARRIAGEYEPDLVTWVEEASRGTSVRRRRTPLRVPVRAALPPLDKYARLEMDGEARLVGAVEATHGCRHRCRHCPLPTVYDGRFSVVDRAVVLADIEQLAAAGAAHITFGDADFFNGPQHSLRIVEEMHERWPWLTYDATIKVEHLLEHAHLLDSLAATGCLFVVSAFETLNDAILDILDKGHTAAGAAAAVHLTRDRGIDLRPTWLPFTPWSTVPDVAEIFSFIAAHDLIGSTDPVQLSIRLLVPKTSLLAEHPAFLPHRHDYDPVGLTYRWTSADPAADALAAQLAEVAESGTDQDPVRTFQQMWRATLAAAGLDTAPADAIAAGSIEGRPRLTESWFC